MNIYVGFIVSIAILTQIVTYDLLYGVLVNGVLLLIILLRTYIKNYLGKRDAKSAEQALAMMDDIETLWIKYGGRLKESVDSTVWVRDGVSISQKVAILIYTLWNLFAEGMETGMNTEEKKLVVENLYRMLDGQKWQSGSQKST